MTKGDWQRIEDAGGPDLCITARDEHGEDGASYAYPGGTIVSTEDSVITSYEAVIRELETREWWTCLGSQAFDACTAKDAQLDFRPSPHVTEVMKIAQKSMFGKDNDKGFKAARLAASANRKRRNKKKSAGDAYKAFRDACKEAKAGMGPPVYVATGPVSKKDGATHAKLHEMGCVTYRNITGYDMLQDWELAAMDQFLLAEAETHVTTACSAADSIAAASRRMRAAAASEVYIATSDAFLDVPNDADERACAKAVDAMARTTDATKSADEAFDDKVHDAAAAVAARIAAEEAAAGGGEGDAADADAGGKPKAKEEAEKAKGAGEDAGEAAPTAGDAPAASAEGEPEGERPAGERPAGERPAGDAEPLPAGAEDRVSAVEQDVSGLKEGMKNIMSTLFNIQEQLKANPGAAAASGAADAAKTAAESTQDSVARIIADAKAARAAVDAAKTASDAKKKASAKANPAPNSASKSKRAAAEDDAAAEDAIDAKAPPIASKPAEKKADDALKAPVAEDDLESYEARMMGPGNVK